MEGTGEFGVMMNTMPKYVVTSTLDKVEWSGSKPIRGDVAAEVRRLKEMPGRDLLLAGSGQLFNALTEEDLIDVYRFMVFPVLLGKGKHLFTHGFDQRNLELTDLKRFATGVVVMDLVPAKK